MEEEFKKIVELSDINLEKNKIIIKDENKVKKLTGLIMFYADWCGHCKTTKPEYLKACKALRFMEMNKGFFYRVDCSKTTKDKQNLMKYCNSEGYPTIVKIVDGDVVSQFNQERTANNFICFELGFGKYNVVDENNKKIEIKCPHIN